MALTINPLACPQNHQCPIIKVCPEEAISQSGFSLPVIDQSRCTECGKCARFCPMKAVFKLR
jgi:Fe-S-cluster-containing hydrogenase component 2